MREAWRARVAEATVYVNFPLDRERRHNPSLGLSPPPILVKISPLQGSNRQSSVWNIFHVWTCRRCDEKPRSLCLLDFLHQRIPSVLSAVYPPPTALFIINNRNRISISPRARTSAKYEQSTKDLLIKFSWMNVSKNVVEGVDFDEEVWI